MEDFNENEILHDSKGDIVILPKGKFVYRLNGRDRKKSASYYTPEILTKSTVKYTLKGFVDKLEAGEMKAEELLELKILEPAMGAAAFQNEVINQLAELYLNYRQKEKGTHISPNEYRYELQRAKAYIATKNIYGVDLNPTAIELGKLSLWLNVIHKDMETPFFGHRIALGNAVIGAWFKAYNETELCKVERGKLVSTNWWEKAPHLLHFSKGSQKIIRKTNEIYHFLVPDKNMLGALKISEVKAVHPNEALRMNKRLKEWTAPLTKENIRTLKALSKKIDELISSCIEYQRKIDLLTQNNFAVWGHNVHQNFTFPGFDDKQTFTDSRSKKGNEFFKLRTILDYWCSLWFWEYEDAALLPTREDYWLDIAQILGINIQNFRADEEPNIFSTIEDEANTNEEVLTIESISQSDAEAELRKIKTNTTLFESGPRIPVVQRLARRYSFFHPMLEFIEVFWLRDGFDIICGNPPWVNNAFDELGIISEKQPEIAIRKVSAPEIRCKRDEMFLAIPSTELLYRAEENETTCSGVFINAMCNYPLLQGMRINLYKCVLENGFSLLNPFGYMGLLHPESIYDDPSGMELRKEVYRRLRYHFQYVNELRLFAEVDHHTKYGEHIYGSFQDKVNFKSIHNLFHPSTIDGCFAHDGHGICGGIKTKEGEWNTEAHKDRVVSFGEEELRVLNEAFENNPSWEGVKLTSIHSGSILRVLEAFSAFPSHIENLGRGVIVSEGLNETTSVDKGWMKRNVIFPDIENMELIYSGPHFYVGNPLYKTPRSVCTLNSDYDIIDLCSIKDNFVPRTNYTPSIDLIHFRSIVSGFHIGDDSEGKPQYDDWTRYYKVGFRRMVGPTSERTLSGAILMKNCNHIGGVVSVTFKDYENLVEFAGLSHSIVLDFYIKTLGVMDIHASRVMPLPIGIDKCYKNALFVRTLALNCLTNEYAELWQEMWRNDYNAENWSITDERLKPFGIFKKYWESNIPLRNYFERRQALVEIDVISAMALGLSLEELEMIYTIQFPVLQQNENDTWYDAKGNIVFTCGVGLKGVGVDRKNWEQIRGDISEDRMTYFGSSQVFVHTVEPEKNELFGGQQVTYYAPYKKCDRIEDYKRAWAHFERIFNKDKQN